MTIKTPHTFFEHQVLTQADFIHLADFSWLITQVENEKLPCFRLIVRQGKIALKISHYLAILRLPSGELIEILPKISKTDGHNNPRQWLNNMLSDIYNIQKKPLSFLAQGTANKQISQTWLQPLIIEWFAKLQALQLPRQYQEHQQNHPQAQGKLLIKQQVKHNSHRPHFRYTSQQQFNFNPLWQVFFYTVIGKIAQLGIPIPHEIKQQFPPIKPLAPNQYLTTYQKLSKQEYRQHLQQQHLKWALQVAWIILQTQAVNPILGEKIAPMVLINMNQAFEQWVTLKLENYFKNQHIIAQTRALWLHNDDGSERYLQPDIIVKNQNDNNKIELVADVKYKTIEKISDISANDLYQLAVYQQHWQAKKVWLIFPKSKGLQSMQILQTVQGQEICIVPFDVECGELITNVNSM
ncbi:MAG: hypothetical protein KGV51_07840 [Moraxellaceae bacterium]|nr:hypothetical protein [Moraxellaceae bacterium]